MCNDYNIEIISNTCDTHLVDLRTNITTKGKQLLYNNTSHCNNIVLRNTKRFIEWKCYYNNIHVYIK